MDLCHTLKTMLWLLKTKWSLTLVNVMPFAIECIGNVFIYSFEVYLFATDTTSFHDNNIPILSHSSYGTKYNLFSSTAHQ